MGNSVAQKDILAQYVHDAVDMESAVYTLNKMEEECKLKKRNIIAEAKNKYNSAVTQLDLSKIKLKETENADFSGHYSGTEEPALGEIIFKGCIFSAIVGCCILVLIGAIILGITCIITKDASLFNESNLYATSDKYSQYLYPGMAIIFIIYCVRKYRKQMNAYNKDQLKHKNEASSRKKDAMQEDQRNVINKQSYVQKAEKNLQIAENESQLIDLQINEIVAKRTKIQMNLTSFYSYGIIPPDYRTFDCVMILDQIFRNDLADTMREAITIYEERVFRGSVIRGMDKIVSMLGQLSSDMSAISLKLDMINNNVAHMSSDLNRFNQRIADEGARNRAATEELINETKLGRYTNEKLLESNKRLEYYAEEYRMGRMPIK